MLPIRDHEPSHRFPFVTIGIIVLNALVFYFELTAPSLEAFIAQWALTPRLVDFGDLATLTPFITSQFLHGGIAHILFNLWYLWIFGDNVEGRLGHLGFLAFYLVSGAVAGLAQFFVSTTSPIPMLGASGAVAGVLGAYLVFFPHHRVDTLLPYFGFWSRTTLPAGVVLFFWFITQLFSGVGSLGVGAAIGGVAFWAHIGGFVFGWVVAQGLRKGPRAAPRPTREFDPEVVDLWK